MHPPALCPDLTRYQQLAAGKLEPADEEALLAHLEGCDRCAQKLKTLGEPDALVNLLRKAGAAGDDVDVSRLVERLSKLRPGDTSAVRHDETLSRREAVQARDLEGSSGEARPTITYAPGGEKVAFDFLSPPQGPDEMGRLGAYRVLQVLGIGGMGVVFRAEDTHLNRLVALKVMLPAVAGSEGARERFLREARAAAALKHDHIVTIYQVGEERGVPFLAMELLEGETLDLRLRREGKLPVAEVLRIGREIALGLAAAHKCRLIHRDIKPANVWLEAETGRVKVLDFGLARAVGETAQLTQQGAIVGTPAYMAPEQARGKAIDGRCDLFSLGCVLYRMVTGRPAFHGTDVVSTLMAVATEEPPSPRQLDAALPAGLSELIMGLLAKEVVNRPASAEAVAEALQEIERERSCLRAPRKRRRIWIGVAALLLCVVLASLWAGGVIRVRTSDGTIVLENIPADAEVFVDGNKVTVNLEDDGKLLEIQVAPGKRKLEIRTAGFKLETREVTLASGERKPIAIRLEPLAPAPNKPPPREVPAVRPSAELEALRRDRIPLEALKLAGNGDPMNAPASLVGVLGEAEPVQTEVVRSLAFSPDGRLLASTSWDKTILLRDVATGRVKRVLKGHTHWVTSVAFSADGRTVVSASQDGTIKFWPLEKAEEPQTLQPDLGGIWEMAVSADGRFLAAGGVNGVVKLWKWGQWGDPLSIPGAGYRAEPGFNGGRNASLALSADGELLAVARHEHNKPAPIRLFRTADCKEVQALACEEGLVKDVSFSADDKMLAAFVGDKGTFIWDLASGKRIAGFYAGQFGTVEFSNDGKTVAVAGRWVVTLYDVASQKKERVLTALGDCFPVAFSPDGKLLAGGFQTGMVHVWDTTSWNEQYMERGHLHYVRGLALSSDGGTLVSVGDDDTLRCWNLAQPAQNRILERFNAVDGPPPFVAYSPDGRKFALVATGNIHWAGPDVMSVWDAAARKTNWSLRLAPFCLAFSPDGKTLVGACSDGSVRLWDTERGREDHRFGSPPKVVSAMAFSKDGKLLAAVGPEKAGEARIWNVASGAQLHSWQDTAMTAVAFQPDDQLLAIGHADGSISLWDWANAKKERTLGGHSAQVQSLKFTPDGNTLISSSHDGTIRLWNPDWERAKQVIALGPPNQRMVIDLDRSGKYLIAGGESPVIYVLRLPGD